MESLLFPVFFFYARKEQEKKTLPRCKNAQNFLSLEINDQIRPKKNCGGNEKINYVMSQSVWHDI
jgi:hypothetical protein